MLIMENKIKFITLFLSIFVCMTSCYKDNYEGPNANFHGKLVIKGTGENFYSEQPNGFQIRFTELSWGDNVTSQSLYGKYDGSFNWDYLFGYNEPKFEGSTYKKATYKLEPYDGAFILDENNKEKIIEVGAGEKVEVNFEVIPFINISDFEYSLEGTKLKVSFVMNRMAYQDRGIDMAGVIVSSQTQYLSWQNSGGYEAKYSLLQGTPVYGNYVDGTKVTNEVQLDPGKTYWMRVGARLAGQSRWNFTEIVEIVVP